jgi:hypothetical protein
MKNYFYIIIGSFLLFLACNNEAKENTRNTSTINIDTFNAADEALAKELKAQAFNSRIDFDHVESLFTYKNIKQINDSNSFSSSKFNRLSADEYYAAFQDTSEYIYEPEFNGAYYYSDQGEWNGLRRYIFVKLNEDCCTYYYYNIYDKTGKLIDSFIIEGHGGDGGWGINMNGTILNDSTVTRTAVECESEEGSENNIEVCDSIITLFKILPTGKLNETQIFKATSTKK